jgi:sugar phosphate isomerase/epimerase
MTTDRTDDRNGIRNRSRREFLKTSALAAAGLVLPASAGRVSAEDAKPGVAPGAAPAAPKGDAKAPLFTISLAQWSLHKAIFGKQLDAFDFPKVAKETYGIDAVEYVNQFYKDKKGDDKAIAELKKRTGDLGVTNVLIMCDGEGALGDPDEAKRKKAVENHVRWLEWAKELGCHSIRVNAQSKGSFEETVKLAADGLRALAEQGEKHGLNVIVENHGGLSSNGDWLEAVAKAVDHKRFGFLPDFGNFYDYDRYKGVAKMMPWAKGASAKTYDFDEKGEETKIDYRKMLKIVLDAGYHGRVGIEYEGKRLPEPEGIKASKALLEKVRAEMSA